MNKEALGQVSPHILHFSAVSLVPPMLHNRSFTHHQCWAILATDRVIQQNKSSPTLQHETKPTTVPDLQPVAQSDAAIKSRNALNCRTTSSNQHSCFAFRGSTLQAVQTEHVQWTSSVPPSKFAIVSQIRLRPLQFTIH